VFSISPAEFATIAIVAVIVVGPKRLPELARKFAAVLRAIRRATAELKTGIEEEYHDAIGPLQEVKDEYHEAVAPLKEMKEQIESMLDMDEGRDGAPPGSGNRPEDEEAGEHDS
jgi:sec-independent protein translocase protein TatB